MYTETHTAAFTRRYSYTERFLHREAFSHRPLHTPRLLCKEFFTQISFHTDALHKDAFAGIKAHRLFYTQNLLHREAFAQNSFYPRSFYTEKFQPRETCTHRLHKEVFGTPRLLRAETLPRAAFTHIFFSAQKPLCTKVFLHNCTTVFSHRHFLHLDAFIRKAFTHRKLCAQHDCTHSRLFTQRLCFSFLITYCIFRVPSLKLNVKFVQTCDIN